MALSKLLRAILVACSPVIYFHCISIGRVHQSDFLTLSLCVCVCAKAKPCLNLAHCDCSCDNKTNAQINKRHDAMVNSNFTLTFHPHRKEKENMIGSRKSLVNPFSKQVLAMSKKTCRRDRI